jgi:hypothetical protein
LDVAASPRRRGEGDRAAAERALDARVHELRAAAAAFGDATTDRVPLPYTHFVQMLVDAFVMLAPAALFPEVQRGAVAWRGVSAVWWCG